MVVLQTDPYKGKGLNGTIPSLLDLSRLMIMDFSGNALGGTLPNLPINLWEAHLSNCNFSGTLPGSYGNHPHMLPVPVKQSSILLTALTQAPCINFCGHAGQLQSLQHLNMANNSLSGFLPASTPCS